jgi:hypothetical protein
MILEKKKENVFEKEIIDCYKEIYSRSSIFFWYRNESRRKDRTAENVIYPRQMQK